MDKASCSILIYDPNVFDGRVIVDNDTEVMDRKAAENEYFHKDFHSSMNMGIHYLGITYGDEGVREYIRRYVKNVYARLIEKIKREGASALAEKIRDTYDREKSTDALTLTLTDSELCVKVKYCPAVKHLKKTGREVSPWYKYTTEWVMKALAEAVGYSFEMISYSEEDGAAEYSFKF